MKDRIKQVRHKLGLTQQKMADRIGIKGNAISQYESGRNEPIDAVVSLICREFNVSEEWLRTGEGEMFVPKEADVLDELAKQYDLSSGDYVLIEKFLKLKPSEREAVIIYMQEVVSSLNAGMAIPAPVPTTTGQEASIAPHPANGREWTREDYHAEIDRHLDEEKEAAESASASSAPASVAV